MEESKNQTIEILEDGPLIVKNVSEFKKSNEETIATKPIMALCRCGHSANKPFCDGAHSTAGFSGKRETGKPMNAEKTYTGKQITIYDNRLACSHAALCVEQLSSVFSLDSRPWINPDGATPQEVVDLVERCPSGALSYAVDGTHYRDQEHSPAISIAKDGPYNITGGITLQVEDELQPPSKTHYSLCRCGVSKNKPYCDGNHDGNHHNSGFQDEKN